MSEQNSNDYLSLTEAGKISGYSQEYLSLRSRQKKLRSVKIGRNWVTTQEWLNEYLNRVNGQKINGLKNNIATAAITSKETSPKMAQPLIIGDNLERAVRLKQAGDALGSRQPRHDFIFQPAISQQKTVKLTLAHKESGLGISKATRIWPTLALATAVGLLTVLSTALIFKSEVLNPVADMAYKLTAQINAALPRPIEPVSTLALDKLKQSKQASFWERFKSNGDKVFDSVSQRIAQAKQKVQNKIATILKPLKVAWQSAWNFATGKAPNQLENQTVSLGYQEGLVVVPSAGSATDQQVKEKIKNSFSDEVRVEPQDSESGLIVPIFKEREGEPYLYMMVPVKDNVIKDKR